MFNAFAKAESHANLRQRAAEKLIAGAPAASKRASQSEALAVLH